MLSTWLTLSLMTYEQMVLNTIPESKGGGWGVGGVNCRIFFL